MERIDTANRILNPTKKPSSERLPAEAIREFLGTRGFEKVTMTDSHFGQCTTIVRREATVEPKPRLNTMNSSVVSSEIAAKVRRAHAGDALEICRLYIEAYTPAEGGEARDHYPFPQILDPCWVAYAVEQESIVWGVAEIDGRVSASAAALAQHRRNS